MPSRFDPDAETPPTMLASGPNRGLPNPAAADEPAGIDMSDVSDASEPDGGYRPVSGLAVAAAITGCASALAFFGPALWFVPIIGAVLAGRALRAVTEPGARLLGRTAAVCGLVLSVGLGTCGATSWLMAKRLADDRAVTVAETWVREIQQGRLLVARSMLAEEARPSAVMTEGGNADISLPIDDPAANERVFRTLPAVALVLGCGPRAAVRGECHEFIPESSEMNEHWRVRVRVAPCGEQGERSLLIHLRRRFARDADTWRGWQDHWSITEVHLER